MNVIFILIAVSLLVAIGFLITFIWSIRTGQYEDEYTPSVRILFDDETNIIEEENSKPQATNSKEIVKNNIQNSKTSNQYPITSGQGPGDSNQEPISNNK